MATKILTNDTFPTSIRSTFEAKATRLRNAYLIAQKKEHAVVAALQDLIPLQKTKSKRHRAYQAILMEANEYATHISDSYTGKFATDTYMGCRDTAIKKMCHVAEGDTINTARRRSCKTAGSIFNIVIDKRLSLV